MSFFCYYCYKKFCTSKMLATLTFKILIYFYWITYIFSIRLPSLSSILANLLALRYSSSN